MKITNSLFLCLNNKRGTIPARIQLIPAGDEIAGVDGRKWTIKDRKALCAKTNALKELCLIDENHSTDLAAPVGRQSPAVGWFENLTMESDGSIWADVDWNSRGQQAVSEREYRFISPVFMSNEKKEVTDILRAALTNTPNLNNPALNSHLQEEPAKEIDMDKDLCAALGLSETATKAECLAAIKAKSTELNVAQTKQVDLAAYAPRADLNVMEQRALTAEIKLKELNASLLKEKAERAVNEAVKEGKIAPASKEEYLNLCSSESGLVSFEAIMAKTPSILGEDIVPKTKAPEGKAKIELNAEERALASSMGYTWEDFKKMQEVGK